MLADEVRRVREEDARSLIESGLAFDWSAALRVAVHDAVPLVEPLMEQLREAVPSPDRSCSFEDSD